MILNKGVYSIILYYKIRKRLFLMFIMLSLIKFKNEVKRKYYKIEYTFFNNYYPILVDVLVYRSYILSNIY